MIYSTTNMHSKSNDKILLYIVVQIDNRVKIIYTVLVLLFD